MKTIAIALLAALPLLGGDLETFTDNALNYTQRNTACFALRGNKTPEVVAAMRAALDNTNLQQCAASNLRAAGAAAELLNALQQDKDSTARAAAARELGTLQKPEYIPILGEAAGDRDPLVASNAIEGLMRYENKSSAPELRRIATLGGIQTTLALDILIDWHDPEVIAIGRKLIASKDPADELVGIRAVGLTGDTTDLPRLKELAKSEGELNSGSRGFGLMPAVSLARAAQTAIGNISGEPYRPAR
jgi:HEAT repeat protein